MRRLRLLRFNVAVRKRTGTSSAPDSCFAAQAAYLALVQLLDHNNQLVLLLVNTLLSDLKSDNFINGTVIELLYT